MRFAYSERIAKKIKCIIISNLEHYYMPDYSSSAISSKQKRYLKNLKLLVVSGCFYTTHCFLFSLSAHRDVIMQ